MNNIAVFDIDGVLADFEPKLIDTLHRERGRGALMNRNLYSIEERFKEYPIVLERALELVNYPLFYKDIKPNPNACKFVKEVMELYDVMYVSSRPREAEVFTRLWLQKNTYNYSRSLGLFCGIEDKADWLADVVVGFVVDDSPEQIGKLNESGKTALCWSQPWNEGVFPRLFSDRAGEIYMWSDESSEAEPFWSLVNE